MPPQLPRDLRRRQGNFSSKDVILVVCTEESEAEYFRWAAKLLGTYPAQVRLSPSADLRSIVDLAVQIRKEEKAKGSPIDRVWCVVNGAESIQDQEVLAFARRNRILIAFSQPSFKVWLMLHHVAQDDLYDDGTLAIYLSQEYPLAELAGNYDIAARRSAQLRGQNGDGTAEPSTDADLVIEDIRQALQRFSGSEYPTTL